MIGIYKITNKINGKSYIGQSNNIERRFQEHQTKGCLSRIPLDVAIQKYGKENFTYEILEKCDTSKLNERETYWIQYYNTISNGYNCSLGGDQQSFGENNGRSKLTEEDVKEIRLAYAMHKRQKEIYQQFSDKISFNSFQNVWQGRSWSHIMPEVFTEENRHYYIYDNSKQSPSCRFTADEVIAIRQRYVNEDAKTIYADYKDKISFQGLQEILWGRRYKDLPLYKKREKKWINI